MSVQAFLAGAPLILEIANKLRERNQADLPPSLSVPQNDLAAALSRLVIDGSLNLGNVDLSSAVDVTDEVMGRVDNAITDFQKQFKELDADGLLGRNTLNFLNLPGCISALGKLTPSNTVRKSAAVSPRTGVDINGPPPKIGYLIESLPDNVSDAETLFEEAWGLWEQHANFTHREVSSSASANIVVRTVVLDGTGGDLADAHVGPPGAMQLELRFDKSEIFSKEKFRYTACHELGHILGLQHTATANQLMGTRFNPNVMEPQTEDIARIQSIWGAADKGATNSSSARENA